ncbi:uncharacterized protein METZ01_LOCUS95824, partial [marine metagenome]
TWPGPWRPSPGPTSAGTSPRGSDRRTSRSLSRQPSSTSVAPTERGWSWPAAEWFIPTCWRRAAWIQRNGRVSPSGLASIAWRSCATELTTFANCSATTTVSCRSS